MSVEGINKGSFLEQLGTGDIERYAHTRVGSGSFYVLADTKRATTVFEIKWDGVDYMPVARLISPGYEKEGSHYRFFLPLDQVWRIGDPLSIAPRCRSIEWEYVGEIVKILFDDTCYGPPRIPELLHSDVFGPG